MNVKLLTEQHLEFLSLKGGYTDSSESTLLEITCHSSNEYTKERPHSQINHTNALAFVMRRLIGLRQKHCDSMSCETVSEIIDVINCVTFLWMSQGFIRLATLKFETKLQKCIRIQNFHFGRYIVGYTAVEP